jgi:predicted MFS family arabinose efflux permease
MLQTGMLRTASPRARGLAGALQVTSFNAGIGVGAMIGAALIGTAGLGVLPLAELVLLAVGLVLSFAPQAVRLRARRLALSAN